MSARIARSLVVCAASYVSAAHANVVCTLVADAKTGTVLTQSGVCDKPVTAASTFKIAIGLMGYDAGILHDEHSPALPFREGYPAWNPAWRATTDPTSWIKHSVVWYSQQVTQQLGEARFKHYVTVFHYGNEDVSGNPGKHDGLTLAWINSSLKISPQQQVRFLRKIVKRQLPVSAHAYDMTSRITAIATLPNGWDVHGKTGTGAPLKADSSADWDHAYGWFVGWATQGERTFVFARLVQDDKREPINAGLRARDAFMRESPGIFSAPMKAPPASSSSDPST